MEQKNREADLRVQKKNEEIEILEAIIQKFKDKEEKLNNENEDLKKEVEKTESELKKMRTDWMKLDLVGGRMQRLSGEVHRENGPEEEADEYAMRKVRQRHAENEALGMLAEEYESRLKDRDRQVEALRQRLEEIEFKEADADHFKVKRAVSVQTSDTSQSIDQRTADNARRIQRWKQVAQALADKLGSFVGEVRLARNQLAKELGMGPSENNGGLDDNREDWPQRLIHEFEIRIGDNLFKAKSPQVEHCGSSCVSWLTRVVSEVRQVQCENKEMSQTISKYREQIREVSTRNELINSEVDKIMKKIPESQDAQQKQISELKAELRKRDQQKKAAEDALNELKDKVIPSLRDMLIREQSKAQEMDRQLEQYADLERKYRIAQENEKREPKRQRIGQARDKTTQSSAKRASLAIRHCGSFWRPKEVKRVICHIEDVTPRLFHKSVKTPVSFDRMRAAKDHIVKSTEIKCGSELNESLRDINTVSTSKNKQRIRPISMFTAKDIPEAKPTSTPQPVDWATAKKVQELLEKLIECKDRITELEDEKRRFKQCGRCLINNRFLLEEVKQNLILSSAAKHKTRPTPGKPSTRTSSDMSKVLFRDNLRLHRGATGHFTKQRMATPLASTKGLNSLLKVTGKKWVPRVMTQENEVPVQSKFSMARQSSDQSKMRLEDFMITPRMGRADQLAKHLEKGQYFSRGRHKAMSPLRLDGMEDPQHDKALWKEGSEYAGLSDTSNFKSFTTFLSIPQSLKQNDTRTAASKVTRGSKPGEANEPVKLKKKRRKGTGSKSKKEPTRGVKLRSLGKEKKMTPNQKKMLKKLLKSMRSESKPKRKKRVKQSTGKSIKKDWPASGRRKKASLADRQGQSGKTSN